IEVGLGVVANAPLVRTPGPVVLDAVAGEDLHAAVVHPHGHLYLHLAVGRLQDAVHLVLQMDELGAPVEDGVDRLDWRHVLSHVAQRYCPRRTCAFKAWAAAARAWPGVGGAVRPLLS